MIPLPQRLALQVGLIFCLIAAALGLANEIGTPTVIMRALACGLAGAAIGAGLGGLGSWFKRIADDLPALPDTAVPAAKTEALPAPGGMPATQSLSEGQPHG